MTDTDLDDVALVRLPPSPTIEPSTPSNLSTLASISTSNSTILEVENPPTRAAAPNPPAVKPAAIEEAPSSANDRVSTAIPTPKSTTGSDASPPPSSRNTRTSTNNPQMQDNCMFCTAETAPPGENLEWIQCNGCRRWSHTLCTGLPVSVDISAIDKFHCKRCEKTRGPTTFRPPPRKSERSHVNIDYTSLNLGDTTNILPDQHAYNAFFESDAPRIFVKDRFKRMTGKELTKEWAEETGCKEPVVIPKGDGDGMGMVMPTDLTVRKVAELVGKDERVEVIDVPTQKEAPNWKLKQWADYYDTPADQRDRVRNVISLEVSSSALGAQVVRPQFVRDLDLIEKIWPRHLRPTSSTSANPSHAAVVLPTATNTPSTITFPKVSLYCLMSVARSYTDFHIDFGGSSVFYHILRGNKTFLFIEPNAANLRRYEAWCLDSEQGNRFLGSEVKECIRVDLSAGDTMIIPSGWIHAVYTPTDSLVLGGNFLTPIHIPSQLDIAAIENRTRVPKKFKFPFFDMAMWYTAIYYIDIYIPRRKRGPIPKSGRKNTEGMCSYEIEGLKILADWLWKKSKLRTQQLAKGAEFHRAKVEVPPGIDAVEIATRYAKWVYDADLPQGTDEQMDLPTWYRNEVLLQKVDTPKKRKREEGEVPSVRKYTRRNVKPQQEGRVEVPSTIREIIPSSYDYFSLSRPVTSYSSISYMSQPSTNYSTDTKFPLITYPPQTNISPSQAFKIFKPYSSQQQSQHTLQPAGESFVAIVKRVCRPYLRPTKPTTVLEEIKVEDGPVLEGLGLLSQAVELTTQPNPPNYAPSSTDSTLTIYSPSEVRLPTPPSQSPPPAPPPQFQDPVMRQAALGLRRARSNSDASSPITAAIAPPIKIRKKPGPKPKNRNPDDPFALGRAITNVSRAPMSGNLTPRRQGRSSGRGLKSISPIARRIPTRVAVENEEAEARRLQSLFTDDELMEFRKLKRRGSDFIFGVAILKKELERLGRKY